MMRIFNIIYHSEFIFRHSKLGTEFQEAIDQIRNFSQKVSGRIIGWLVSIETRNKDSISMQTTYCMFK